uniref:NAC transcription factor 29 n=1 Tax=Tanacetum cinerariifolium TaxID=118510 RepID=A0A699GJZ6_TANCI|nr:NAC transcription factor 29 [Tanacetum cinerariifolium]
MDPAGNPQPHEMYQFQHDDVDVKLRSRINNEELNYYPIHQHVYTTTPEILVGNHAPVEGKHYFLTERSPTRRGFVRKVEGGHWTVTTNNFAVKVFFEFLHGWSIANDNASNMKPKQKGIGFGGTCEIVMVKRL